LAPKAYGAFNVDEITTNKARLKAAKGKLRPVRQLRD
jgi:hypothetical protein